MVKLRDYANEHGNPDGRPYFSDEVVEQSSSGIDEMKQRVALRLPKFHCPVGMTNVWSFPHLSGEERVRVNGKNIHPNQKPLAMMDLIVNVSSDEGDVVWEPFGGLFSASLSAVMNNRIAYGAEISSEYYDAGVSRFDEKNSIPVQMRLF